MMQEKEKIGLSVILLLPFFEPAALKISIESILAEQDTFQQSASNDFYLRQIIMLNCSEGDDCLSWLQEHYENEERILLLKKEKELSLGAAINEAVLLAEGKYISFLTIGNYWLKGKSKIQLDALEGKKIGKVIYSIAETRNKKEQIPPLFLENCQKAGKIFPDLIRTNFICIDTLMMNRVAFIEIQGMDEELPAYVVEEFLLRLSLCYPIVYQNQVTTIIQKKVSSKEEEIAVRLLLLEEYRVEIIRIGLADEILIKIYEEAEKEGLLTTFWQYAEYLREDSLYQTTLDSLWKREHPARDLIISKEPTVAGVVNCVGCCGCESVCPVDAITMVYGKEGFLYPEVNKEICILCGKCLRICPTQQQLHPTPISAKCYALQAGKEIQKESSSGGIFPLLAKDVLEKGGYVAGAVYDQEFQVHHILSNTMEDLLRMQSSKYVQSDTRGIFEQVKRKLREGKEVLFTGTACQVAGLQGYLGKEYENLHTVDVVCHGVPSPTVYKSYLEEHKRRAGEISELNFRKKEILGWKSGVYICFKNGQSYVAKGYDPYMAVFLNDWGLRRCCYSCEFKEARYSDITLGDFWGIERLDPDMEVGDGTSVVFTNTQKGVEHLGRIYGKLYKRKAFDSSKEFLYNPSINTPVKYKKFREIFFEHFCNNEKSIVKKPLQNTIVEALHSIKFDIGLVLWWSPNYGNALTNFALYKILERKYKVMAIDNITMSPMGRFERFAKEYYELSSDYFPRGARELIGNACKTYIVGSDQTWNYYFTKQFGLNQYFQLDFVPKDKNKISYAASFGTRGAEGPAEEYKKAYQRLDAISVREQFGVESCKKYYDMEATWVLDPVFLLEASDYDCLAEKSKVKETEPFLLCYLLNPSPEKVKICREAQKLLGNIKMIHISENNVRDRERNRHLFNFENVLGDIEVEDWIYYFKNAEYVITDSFHGTCFSVIFQKRFMSFVNRQRDRFLVFDKFSYLSEHILTDLSSVTVVKYMNAIDYDTINKELQIEKEKSLKWLEEHVNI